jgi:MFS family permease
MLTQSMASICSGQYISRQKRYGECIWLGFTLLTVGTSITTLFNRSTPVYGNVLTLVLLGIGNGNVFQPTIISLQAHSPKAQRAIVISIRNFIRCLGGAIGLAVSAAILQNTLRASLPERFQDLAHSVYTKPNYSLYDAADQEVILGAYEKASHAVFVLYAPVAGICLLCCVFVKDRGLQRKEEVEAERIAQEMAKNSKEDVDNQKDVERGLGSTESLPDSHADGKEKEHDEHDDIQKPAPALVSRG